MIDLEQIRAISLPSCGATLHMLKEYIQLMILDFLSTSPYIEKIVFIGETNLRLVKGIDRFLEDLDFDCKNFSQEEFTKMTDDLLKFLQRSGFNARHVMTV